MATYVATKAPAAVRTRRPAAATTDPILASKVTPPAVPGWAVARPRISKLIGEGARWCPLTVVTGPPGAGKTMALALWASAEPRPVAWVSLDRYDNRPGIFWSHVAAALRRSGVAVPAAPDTRIRAADHMFLLHLASALAAQNPPVMLVLDDLHLVTEPKVLTGLDFVARNTGPGLRLVVAARMDPLLRLHRYRLAGELAEIRARDLAFSTAEAGELLAQHDCTLPADSLALLTRRTEGWAAGLRLAAISMHGHPDPGRFVQELITENSALTSYLVDEVLNAQSAATRQVLLGTSIMEHVSGESASELCADEHAAGILHSLARTNTFLQPIGGGWYRYHTLLAEVLRLKLRREQPGRVAVLHRRAARWCERNGQLADAVRHAAEAGDWPLAASMVIGGLAVSELIEPRDGRSLAGEFAGMPDRADWAGPQPYLVSAALALAAGQPETAAVALNAADGILRRLPAGTEPAARLAALMIRLTAAHRAGQVVAAAVSADAMELASRVQDDQLARQPNLRAQLLASCGSAEFGSGRLDEAAQVFAAGVAAATASGGEQERADCLGQLALVEAARGHLSRAAELAGQTLLAGRHHPSLRTVPAALLALAWVHLERNELAGVRQRLAQLDAALAAHPDKLTGTMAWLVAAYGGLADGRAEPAGQLLSRARSGGPVPAWLEQSLSLAEARVRLAAGDIRQAWAAAERAGGADSPAATVMLAAISAAAGESSGESSKASSLLAATLAAPGAVPERVRLHAWLVDARVSYGRGDRARCHRSLASALRLAEREQIRLPFALERGWLGPVLRRDPELARSHQHLLAAVLPPGQIPAQPAPYPDQMPVTEPLTEREREVLRHVSGMLNTAEVASEMYISVNTVKTHLKSIYRKLAAAHRGEAVRRARQLELI
ncbi:MAG TPA: LuxR C-terminal-related transcriptional regulator [Streptosporangiaceae bacterium]